MPRGRKGKSPTNPNKRAAAAAADTPQPPTTNNHHQQRRQWQPPRLPSKFQLLQRSIVMDILSRLPIKTLFDCSPIIGEYITIPGTDEGRPGYSSVGLGFSIGTNEYKVVQSFKPVMSDNYEAEIYTIGTGVWRSIGNAYGGLDCQLPFNAYLRGALHWVSHGSESSDVSELINSFDFEREQFRPLPPPSYFGPREKQFSDCLKLGVLEGCLVLCVFGDDSSKFDMWL